MNVVQQIVIFKLNTIKLYGWTAMNYKWCCQILCEEVIRRPSYWS